jgi:hypothetical protein
MLRLLYKAKRLVLIQPFVLIDAEHVLGGEVAKNRVVPKITLKHTFLGCTCPSKLQVLNCNHDEPTHLSQSRHLDRTICCFYICGHFNVSICL